MDTTDAAWVWRKAQRSENGHCVEVASLADGVAVRDSKRPEDQYLSFSRTDWATFLSALRTERISR